MSEAHFQTLLAGNDAAPIVALDERQLDQAGDWGPASYYYLARWIESRSSGKGSGAARIAATDAGSASSADSAAPSLDAASERVRLLLRKAFDSNGGIVRRESGAALAQRLLGDGAAGVPDAWPQLASFDEVFHASLGADWTVDRSYVAALDALGRNEEELAAISSLRSVFPAESAADADALFYYQGCADQRMGRPGWAASLRTILFERPTSAWTARALDFVEAIEPHTRDFSAAERGVVRMRLAVAARDYGVAYHEAMAARKLVFTAKASPLVVADAGKAFLYSGQSKEGLGLFASLEESARSYADSLGDVLATARSARVAWTAAFYRARFYRALERWKEAEGLFERLAAGAGSPEDADAARWYAVDGADKVPSAASRKLVGAARDRALRRVTLDALQRAALSWYDPSLFSDLADALFREALQARDWELIYDMAGSAACRTSPVMAARCAYVAARAHELGLATESDADAGSVGHGKADLVLHVPAASQALDSYRAIMNDPSLPLHYRALAAWRLGEEPSLLPPDRSAPENQGEPDPLEGFLSGFERYEMADLMLNEASQRSTILDRESLRRLATLLAQEAHPDLSMRLIGVLMKRADWDPRRSDFELLYPRPYLSEVRSLRSRINLPEPIVLGLLRSESYFQADVVSAAGAVGLAQLMPSTAAEIARTLGIASYDLTKPRDNLRFGIAYFSDLLAETGHPLQAMWAYNAGRSRLKKWNADMKDLPDDLKLEALGIEETRQYGRNILQASVMYGELYYGVPVATMTGEIVDGERAWLRPEAPPITGP